VKILIFSDLDGTLLDHFTYQSTAARQTLAQLKSANIPVILNTSKTFAELEVINSDLQLNAPFIVENGAATYIPMDTLKAQPADTVAIGDYWVKSLLDIRIKQSAFHPNATQFTLHLGLQLFGFWRQSKDRRQSIFCVSNISDQPIDLPLSELNLIITESWIELITNSKITELTQEITLAPYQTVWISNRPELT